jgi:hypothetical protein
MVRRGKSRPELVRELFDVVGDYYESASITRSHQRGGDGEARLRRSTRNDRGIAGDESTP